MIAWMIYSLIVGALLALGAFAVERGARRLGLAGRWAWIAAIALTLALPLLAPWRPNEDPVDERPVVAEATLEATAIAPGMLAGGDRGFIAALRDGAREVVADVQKVLSASAGQMARLTDNVALDRAALALWLLASLGVAGAIGIAAMRLAVVRREWGLELVNEQFVRVSEDVGPAVVGFLRGEIVVPEWALDLPVDRRAMLLAHEREHLAARDPMLLVAALGALALMPWNVALWWQVKRLRLAVEMDCDRRVLRRGSDVRAYGALLIEVGRRSAHAPLAAAAFSEPATHLERRIHMMLARPPRWRVLRAAALALVGAGIVFVACDMQPPVGPEPENEVALSEFAYTSRSYNVKEGMSPAVLREALAAHHPDLLRQGEGRSYMVFFVFDSEGRLVDTDKAVVEERPAGLGWIEEVRSAQPKRRSSTESRRMLVDEPANIVVRARDGQIESVEVEKRATEALRERQRIEGELVELRADSMRVTGDRIQLRPTERKVTAEGTGVGYEVTPARESRALRERALVEAQATVRARRPLEATLAPINMPGLDRMRPEDIASIEIIKGGVFAEVAPAVQGVIVIRKK